MRIYIYKGCEDDMKLRDNNPIEDELDAIRIKIYEHTKHMSSAERVEYFNRRTQEVFKEFGINAEIVSAFAFHRFT